MAQLEDLTAPAVKNNLLDHTLELSAAMRSYDDKHIWSPSLALLLLLSLQTSYCCHERLFTIICGSD
jgi:hypothetical protein